MATVLVFLLLSTAVLCSSSTNYTEYFYSGGDDPPSLSFIDERVPVQSTSPGWIDNPRDIKTVVGKYVYFTCRNRLAHNQTVWLLEGREDIFYTKYSTRVALQNSGKTLRFGPVSREDDRISINCEIWTKYGALPSPLGMIYVQIAPRFKPSPKSVFIGSSCFFDFGFSGSRPDSYSWYKNGRRYYGQINRVVLTHRGIAFTKVLQHDSGIYEIRAKNRAGTGKGSGYLRVIFWWRNGTAYQHAGLSTPDLPVSVAVAIAISENKTRNSSLTTTHSTKLQVSTSDSTAYAMRVLRKLNNKATEAAKQQGRNREEVEHILYQMVKIIGHPLKYLNSSDMDQILNATNCLQSAMMYNCLDYRVLRYRTINGTCNNLFFPLNGAANVAFARMLPAEYEDGIAQPYGYTQARTGRAYEGPWPSPRYISWHLVKDMDHSSNHITHMFMAWGQFLDHDLDLAPVFEDENGEEFECDCNFTTKCFPILVRPEDPVFGVNSSHRGHCLPFTRSIAACQCPGHNELARTQVNQLTSFIDGSQVYGSDDEHASNLRLFIGGLLKSGGSTSTSRKENLPFQEKMAPRGNIPLFDAGDTRSNEVVTLTVMHTIWMREHNRIARKLGKINPCWNDEKIYQETRRIIGAMIQVITYREFLPTLFGQYYQDYVPTYYGYNPFVDATIPNEFSAAAFRFGHSLVRPVFQRLDKNWQPVPEGPLPLERAFFNPIEYFKSNGTDELLRGLMLAQAREVDEFVNNILTTKLFTEVPERLGMDLASLNIQRGRDHGVAPYRKWRKLCGNIFPQRNVTFRYPNTESVMKEIYGERGFREGMDLWVGGLSEKPLPSAHVGPTFACILGMTFTRLRDGDRFWYESPYNFRSSQVRELRKVKLSKVVCQNADDINEVQPNIMLGNQRRMSCDHLPEINLYHWRDSYCSSYGRYGRSIKRRLKQREEEEEEEDDELEGYLSDNYYRN